MRLEEGYEDDVLNSEWYFAAGHRPSAMMNVAKGVLKLLAGLIVGAACVLALHYALSAAEPTPEKWTATVAPAASQLDDTKILMFVDVYLGDERPTTSLAGTLTIQGTGGFIIPTWQSHIQIERDKPFSGSVRHLIAIDKRNLAPIVVTMLCQGPRTASFVPSK